jgi:cytochrome c biogenesis factor
MIGVDVWYNQAGIAATLGAAMVGFSLLLLIGSSMYARYTPTPPEQRKAAVDQQDSQR